MSCPSCQQPFYAQDIRQLYCSAACRQLGHQAAHIAPASLTWEPQPLPPPMPWKYHEVPVAIVAHPKRYQWATEMALEVAAEAVCIDNAALGCEVNHLRAWNWLGGGSCPWSVVLEDDALPIPQFRRQLHSVLQVAPTPIVGLYLGQSRPPHWQPSIARAVAQTRELDACFLRSRDLLHGVGYAIRTELISDLLDYVPHLTRANIPIDEAISAWARDRALGISHTWPSLVDHRDEKTLVHHRDGQPRTESRKAWHADWRERWEPTLGEIALPDCLTYQEEKNE